MVVVFNRLPLRLTHSLNRWARTDCGLWRSHSQPSWMSGSNRGFQALELHYVQGSVAENGEIVG